VNLHQLLRRHWLLAAVSIIAAFFSFDALWIPVKAELAQHLLERAWLRTLEGEPDAKPWPWADTWPVARLTVKQRDVDLIVLAGGSGRTLAFGPGHLSASAMPGETGNAIIGGHRDTHFQFLRNVEVGELLGMETTRGQRHIYKVVGVDIVDSRKGSLVLDTDAAMLTLVTCYPFDALEAGGPLRYVVTARMMF